VADIGDGDVTLVSCDLGMAQEQDADRFAGDVVLLVG
jgi:hypothetical protein